MSVGMLFILVIIFFLHLFFFIISRPGEFGTPDVLKDNVALVPCDHRDQVCREHIEPRKTAWLAAI